MRGGESPGIRDSGPHFSQGLGGVPEKQAGELLGKGAPRLGSGIHLL
jgi:hypothetical protein